MKKFLKLFFVTGLLFGFLQLLFHRTVLVAAIQGLYFGLIMASVMCFLEKRALRKMGKTEASVGVKQEMRFTVKLSKLETLEKVKHVFAELNAKIINYNSPENIIEGRTTWSWKSFGEILTVRFVDMGNQTGVYVESRPSLGTIMVDYGKNLENVEKFRQLMEK